MAREPYRSRMLADLLSLPAEDQLDAMREFVVHEAGSSHSDVIASDYMHLIVVNFKKFKTGYPDQNVKDPYPIGGEPARAWWLPRKTTRLD